MKKSGFTLVELSIVLVIIGLLIGGILVAQSMIGTAKIQSQIRQLQQYDIAITNFKTKFNQIPGDCSICRHTSTGLSEGNNDGLLNDASGNVPVRYFYLEPVFFFRDLYVMGVLTGEHISMGAGRYDSGGIKDAFPPAAIGRGGVAITGNRAGELYYAFIQNSTVTNDYHWNTRMVQGNFTPAEALAVDSKLDDGAPDAGNVAAVSINVHTDSTTLPFQLDATTNCRSSATQYNMASTATNPCRLVIKSNFK